MASKAQWRNVEAQRLTLDLIELGHIRKSEKVAGRLLLEACITAEERTRKTEKQKSAYVGVEFGFQLPLEMAIYIITELPYEWEYCKVLKTLWQQAKGKKAKKKVKPSIDRIYTKGFRKHYERNNIRVEAFSDNRDRAVEDRKQPFMYTHVTEKGVETLRFEGKTEAKKALGKNFKYAVPDVRLQMLKGNDKFYARYVEYSTFEETYSKLLENRDMYLEENGLMELTANQ